MGLPGVLVGVLDGEIGEAGPAAVLFACPVAAVSWRCGSAVGRPHPADNKIPIAIQMDSVFTKNFPLKIDFVEYA